MAMLNENGIRKLQDALAEAGLPHSRAWVYRRMRSGKLTLPKKAYADRQFELTDEVVALAVESLRLYGEFHWTN